MTSLSIKNAVKKIFVKSLLEALKDPQVEQKLWNSMHRPKKISEPGPEDIWVNLWHEAGLDTAKYVRDHMLTSKAVNGRFELFDLALGHAGNEGLYLEFGAGHNASSINYLAKKIKGNIHGFDSFEGLPEAWFGEYGKGSLSSNNMLPKVDDNVILHAGWFDQSLPEFIKKYDGNVAFMHIDCDLYSSTKTIFDCLKNRIISGTVIQFDEYFNYPGWQQHEYKAFQEFVSQNDLEYEYLGYDARNYSVAVKIL